MAEPIDIALTEDWDGEPTAHDPACPIVLLHRQLGRPIFTLLDCQVATPPGVRRHVCLTVKDKDGRATL